MCTVFIIKVPYGFLRTPRPKLRKKSPSAENTLTQWSSFTNTSPFALTTTDEGRFNYKTHATASDTYAANSQIVHRRLLKSQRHTSWKNVRMNFPLMSNFLTLFDPWLQMKISFLWFIVTPVNELPWVILFEDNDGNHIYNVFIRLCVRISPIGKESAAGLFTLFEFCPKWQTRKPRISWTEDNNLFLIYHSFMPKMSDDSRTKNNNCYCVLPNASEWYFSVWFSPLKKKETQFIISRNPTNLHFGIIGFTCTSWRRRSLPLAFSTCQRLQIGMRK